MSLGGPESQKINSRGSVTGDGDVVGDPYQLFGVVPLGDIVPEVVEDILDHPVKLDLRGVLGSDDLPRGAVFHPIVWKFDLIPISELLLEETVLVMDAIPDGGQIEGGQRVKEAGSQAPEAAVAESHVVLLLTQFVDVETKFANRLLHILVDAGTVEAVDVEASHQKLEGEVVEPLHILVPVLGLRRHETLDHHALDSLGSGQPPIAFGGGLRVSGQTEPQLILDQGLHSLNRGVEGRVEVFGCCHKG